MATLTLIVLMSPGAGHAQTTDITSSGLNTTVGAPTTLPNDTINYDITGGSRPGNGPNLFHSFGEFSVGANNIANFLNETALPTSNILSRVTGGNPSNIFGTLQTTDFGAANLYLINPAGVIFGPTAELNVGGSVNISTADYLKMTDGATFSANPAQPTVLSIAPVAAFGFLGSNPLAPISVQQSQLVVPTGHTLSLLGGDITIVGRASSDPASESTLIAPSGRVNLVSVASGGEMVLNVADEPPSLRVDSFERLGTISINDNQAVRNDAVVNVRGDPGGTIFIRSERLELTNAALATATLGAIDHPGLGFDIQVTDDIIMNNSELGSSSFGAGNAGAVRITADSLQLIGDPARNLNSNIGSRSFSTAAGAGDAGTVDITTGNLRLTDNAFIETLTAGPGNAGNISIKAGSLELLGERGPTLISTQSEGTGNAGILDVQADMFLAQGGIGFTGLSSLVNSTAQGNANGGLTRVSANTVQLLNGAQVNAGLFAGSGQGGNVEVIAHSFVISGRDSQGFPSGVFSNVQASATGSSGDISILSKDLTITEFGRVQTTTRSPGDAGHISISTDSLTVSNLGQVFSSSFEAGRSGDITIVTKGLNLINGGQVTASAFGTGQGGNISVVADTVLLSGVDPFFGANPSAIAAQAALGGFGIVPPTAMGGGSGGTIRLTVTGSLQILDGARISAQTLSPGDGGNIDVRAGSIEIAGANASLRNLLITLGRDPIAASAGILADANNVFIGQRAAGKSGNIRIETSDLKVAETGRITVGTSGSAGDGGSIELVADSVMLSSGALVSAQSTGSLNAGNSGSITLAAPTLTLEGAGTTISTSSQGSGTAGTIALKANNLTMAKGGMITSSSTSTASNAGSAGQIEIQGLAGPGSPAKSLTLDNGTISTIIAGGTSSTTSATIDITAQTVNLTNAAQISADTIGGAPAGAITLTATESIALTHASGVSSSSSGSENAGGVSLTAPAIILSTSDILSSIGNGIDPTKTGGAVTLTGRTITIGDGSSVRTDTSGAGRGGKVTLVATEGIGIEGVTRLGNASQVFARTFGSGEGGAVFVKAPMVDLDQGAISVRTSSSGTGNAGNVVVEAGRLSLAGGATIDSSTDSPTGHAGTITVRATEAVVVEGGVSRTGFSGMLSTQAGIGSGGDAGLITVTAPLFRLGDGGAIQASTVGKGAAGSVSLDVGEFQMTRGAFISSVIEVPQTTNLQGAQPSALVQIVPATAGDLTIRADNITMSSSSNLFANSNDLRNAGDILLESRSNLVLRNSFISTDATQASGGNIKLTAPNLIRIVDSTITSSVEGSAGSSDGGNINIDPQLVVIQNSNILAKAFQGNGGNITIAATGAVLVDPNSQLNTDSVLGVRGSVNINAPIQILSGALVPLTLAYSQAGLSGDRCAADPQGQFSSFVQTGRDGVPQVPGALSPSPLPFLDPLTSGSWGSPVPNVAAARLGLNSVSIDDSPRFRFHSACRS